MRWAPLAVLASAFILGCPQSTPRFALVQLGAPPAELGEPSRSWMELESKHFVMDAEVSERQAEEMIATFERAYATLEDVAFPPKHDAELPRIRVIVFETQGAYEEFAPRASGAYFMAQRPAALEREETLVLYGGLSRQVELKVYHELTHRFVRRALGGVATWLSEGLADYFSTLRVGGGRVTIGEPMPNYALDYTMVPKIEELISLDRSSFYAESLDPVDARRLKGLHYIAAWALVHMLMNGPPEYRRAPQLFDLITQHVKTKDAFLRVFKDTNLAKMNEDFKEYLSPRSVVKMAKGGDYPDKPVPPLSAARYLAASEVHALRAELFGAFDDARRARFEVELAAAEQKAPKAVRTRLLRAQLLRATGKLEEAEAVLDALGKEAPSDVNVLTEVTRLANSRTSKRPREQWGLERFADPVNRFASVAATSDELELLARYYAARNLSPQGLRFIKRSLDRDPLCPPCLSTLSMLLAEKGDLDGAIEALEKAIDSAPDYTPTAPMALNLRALEERRAKAPTPQTPPPPAEPSKGTEP